MLLLQTCSVSWLHVTLGCCAIRNATLAVECCCPPSPEKVHVPDSLLAACHSAANVLMVWGSSAVFSCSPEQSLQNNHHGRPARETDLVVSRGVIFWGFWTPRATPARPTATIHQGFSPLRRGLEGTPLLAEEKPALDSHDRPAAASQFFQASRRILSRSWTVSDASSCPTFVPVAGAP